MRKLAILGALLFVFQMGCHDVEQMDDTVAVGEIERGLQTLSGGSCQEHCGGYSPDGCWCDEGCTGYGDCCADYDAICNAQPSQDSCEGHCGGRAPGGCWCDSQCQGYGDCCDDYGPICEPEPDPGSCEGYCGGQAPDGCWCNPQCEVYGDCCPDYVPVCTQPEPDPNSCEGHCGEQAPGGCWCNPQCQVYGDCCPDYVPVCTQPEPDPNSCEGHCGEQAPGGCWCNTQCQVYGDCCPDYVDTCTDGGDTDPWTGMTDSTLVTALGTYTSSTHAGLSYTNARNEMYGVSGGIGFDVHGGQVECIYTGLTAAADGTRTPGGIINTEHSWPRSKGADSMPAIGDLHHLFPSYHVANSQRSNYDFGTTVCNGAGCLWAMGGSQRGHDSAAKMVFQVRPQYRGDIARAQFYFSVRYDMAIPDDVEAILKQWHVQDPPDQRELDRNDVIETLQGNRNPFVDYPHITNRISDF